MKFDEFQMDGFVEQLVEHSKLTERQAQVYTLRKIGYPRGTIAEILGVSEGAVDSHYSSARDVVSTQMFGTEMHFYDSETGKIPLEWEARFSVGRTSYILCEPRTDVVASETISLESDVKFLTIYPGDVMDDTIPILENGEAQYLPMSSFGLPELGRVFRAVFAVEVGEHEANVFEGVFTNFVHSDVTRKELYREILWKNDSVLSNEFFASVSQNTRFVVFSEMLSISNARKELVLGRSIETDQPVGFSVNEAYDWLSIVGKIGTGKSFTLDLILSQLAHKPNVQIIEFNPFVEHREDVGEYESYPKNATRVESQEIEDWFDAVFKRVENASDTDNVCAVAEEAHYLLREHPERFAELVTKAKNTSNLTLITTTQTFKEFMEESESVAEIHTDATWIFHHLDEIPDRTEVTVPEQVKRLNIGSSESPAEAILVKPDADHGFMFRVSLNGFTV